MCENTKKHVHFMGICGSGCASIAMLAHAAGYLVSGCDQSTESYYAGELKKLGIKIYAGHDAAHLEEGVDIVAVSPALFDISPDNPELLKAREMGILMTWQEFMGRYLQEDKRVIAISGTHGKTTTTFLTAELLIDAGLDPTVEGGSVYKKWGSGGRPGGSDLFLCEADEFNRNFYNYHPEIAVLNNVEMDHPECYDSYEDLLQAFKNFLINSGRLKTVILNADSKGCMEVLQMIDREPAVKDVQFYAITRNQDTDFSQFEHRIHKVFYCTEKKEVAGTVYSFVAEEKKHTFTMKLFGEYNVSNAVVAVLITQLLGSSDESIAETLKTFSGVGRRFDPVGSFKNVPVFDDYAHHPTEISSVLGMCRDYFPDKKLLAVFEPHQVSRLTLMFDEYRDALTIADTVIIGKTHIGREIHKGVTPISKERWTESSDKILYEEDPAEIKKMAGDMIDRGQCDLIVVIGAANSYKISRLMCSED